MNSLSRLSRLISITSCSCFQQIQKTTSRNNKTFKLFNNSSLQLQQFKSKPNSNNLRSYFSTSPAPKPANGSAGPGSNGQVAPKLTLFQRFKSMYKDYWYVLVPVHIVTSIGWIGSFYYFVKSGVDLGKLMRKVGFSDSIVDKITKSGAGALAVAYGLYKIATPARYFVTLGGTTISINILKRWGYIRPAKEIYSNNRDKFHKRIQKQRDKYKKK